ncbi:MAG: hypothetical protein K2O59_17105 [Lachnospiraceae bacterium]|nr:hypothetical protein [Lachnospiraceae bacterium]
MCKKIWGLILAVCTLFLLTPDTVMAAKMQETSLPIQETVQQPSAEETAGGPSMMEGAGTETAPYRIKNAEQFCAFADMVNGVNGAPDTGLCAVLTCDIDLSGVYGADSNSWTPIGTSLNPYTGVFDGDAFAIYGLYCHRSNSSYAGLFGYNAGVIKNLGVANADVAGGSYTGGVCGFNIGTITGCYNTASVKGNDYTGGVCGYNDVGGNVSICYNMGAVSGRKYVGGICGYNKNTTADCYNMGSINGKRTSIGGICGYNRASVSNCFNTGAVSNGGRKYIGSICGYNHSQSSFLNCYYLITGEEKGNYGVAMTQEQFASGEVCWLLNDGRIENVIWHQTCGAGFPAFGGKVVYQVRRPKADGRADEMIVAYTNEKNREQASTNNVSAEENHYENKEEENRKEHVYAKPEWVWQEYDAAKAILTCQDCGEKWNLTASISEKITEATCAKEGKIVYTASVVKDGEIYTDQKTEKLEKTAHRTLVPKAKTSETCTEPGISQACWNCPACGNYFEDQAGKIEIPREKVEIPAKGHLYGKATWDWNMGNNPPVATASFTCGNGCGTTEKKEGTVSSETNANCTTAGNTVYTAVVSFNGEIYKDTKSVSGQPTPHSYGEPVWKWAANFSTASATFTCKVCGYSETKDTTPASERKESTCVAEGEVKYTAVVTFGGREYADEKKTSLPIGTHNFGKPKEWIWSPDYSQAAATFICAVCGKEVSEQATVTKDIPTGSTCGTPGEAKFRATVTFEGNTYDDIKTKQIVIDHTLKHFPKVPAQCETEGNEEYWECEVCHKLFGDEAGTTVIPSAPAIPAKGHTLEHENKNIYICTTCNKRFTVTVAPDGTTITMYSIEEDAIVIQDETENSEEKQENTEVPSEDEQAGEVRQGEPEGQNEEAGQSESEEQNENKSSDAIFDVPENTARYGLIYPEGEGEEAAPVITDAWEGNAINLRAESAGKTAAQTAREQQQGYPLWVSVTVLAALAGVVLVLLCKRKVIGDKG